MVEKKVMEVIKRKIGPDMSKVALETPFEEFGMDSLDRTEFVMGIEDEFGINIPDTDARQLITVSDLVKYIREKTKSLDKVKN